MSKFKKENTEEKRKQESTKIRAKFPDRIPIIVEKRNNCKNIPSIDKNKYLVPSDLTVGQFMYIIRKRIKLNSSESLFIFINNILPTTSQTVGHLYKDYQDKDGFLYFTIQGQNTFGI